MLSVRRHLRQAEAGFTLVEVMTVVFIIGLTSTLVILTMPERPAPSERSAEAFSRDVRQTSDRAILTGRVQAIDIVEDGYERLEWLEGQWTRVGRPAARRSAAMDLSVRGDRRDQDEAELLPELVFDPTGVNDPVELELRMGGERYVLNVSADGEVSREAR